MLNNRLQRENLHTSESASEPQKGTQPLLVQPGRGESVSGQSSAGIGHTSAGEWGRRNHLALSHRVAIGRNSPGHVIRRQQERWGKEPGKFTTKTVQ